MVTFKSMLNKILACLLLSASATYTYAYEGKEDLSTIISRLVDTVSSAIPLITMCAFIIGMISLFKAITTIMNYSDNPKEYPLKNAVFYGLAAAIGLGYTFASGAVVGTIFKDADDLFDSEQKFNLGI